MAPGASLMGISRNTRSLPDFPEFAKQLGMVSPELPSSASNTFSTRQRRWYSAWMGTKRTRLIPPIGWINRMCGTGRVRSHRSLAGLTPA